jgi:protein-S-isoprenylcysteine O-methyltransferase Ste14
MISGVIAILLGEALIFGSLPLLLWALFFGTVNAVYIPFSEEPGLAKRFGDEYRLYQRHVPRWLPRLRPWRSPTE